MKRILPSSLLGQVMASVTLALLIAQIVAVTLLYRAGEERRESAAATAAAFRLINAAELDERRKAGNRLRGERPLRDRGPARLRREPGAINRLPPPLRYQVTQQAPLAIPDSETDLDARLRSALAREGVEPFRIVSDVRRAGEDRQILEFVQGRTRFANNNAWRNRSILLASIQREQGGNWETVRILEPRQQPGALVGLIIQTLITFAFLFAILFFVLRRITRPLAALTSRVGDFSQRPERSEPLAQSGPSDTRRLISAYNSLEARIATLLDEKDVMLGAIGHDLKTPLAALRVRIESVPDDAQRAKMAEGIEDITTTLDDILSLARVGRADALSVETVDLGALAIGVTEEFEDLGQPVTILDPPRMVARVQVTWIKRALRNLVSNAVRYGQSAEIALLKEGSSAVLRVEDTGPGIPEDRIAGLFEPFARGENSRSRSTGGAGLGLTLARAIADQHGGELVLENREQGGLRAEIRLPL